MARNTLSDEDVSIVKALLNLGEHSNQEIAGLVNRSRGDASKDVSTGRISNIKNGQTKKYLAVEPASSDAVNLFIEKFELPDDQGPVSRLALRRILAVDDSGRLAKTETDRIECKLSFSLGFDEYVKTIAGFANNKGGYFLFGVEDGTWKTVGLSSQKLAKFQFDAKKFNGICRSYFRREIQYDKTVFSMGDKKIGVLYIHEENRKPVICQKAHKGTGEGHIYYRYPGETRQIGPHELERLIDARIADISETDLTKRIANILRFGVQNSAVLNLTTGELNGSQGKLVVDASSLEGVGFIKEGEFDEKSGAPVLKVVGSVSSSEIEYKSIEEDRYPFKPSEVVAAVRKGISQPFTQHTHVNACRRYSVRPKGSAKKKGKTKKEYAVYHKHSNSYTYSQAWIDFLVSELVDEKQYVRVRDFHKNGS